MNNKKDKPNWPLQRLKRMYFAMHCWKCKKFELPAEEYKQICEKNIQRIVDNLQIKEMKFKEFNTLIKNSTFCRFEKRDFRNNCPICRKLKIKQISI